MTYCNNCGHESHCGNRYSVTDKDITTGESYEREVCPHCNCKKCIISIEDEEKYNIES